MENEPEKKLLDEFVINKQIADNLGSKEMIVGLLSGVHYFANKAEVYFKDLNLKDEFILGDKKVKIYLRDIASDEDILIPDEFFLKHPEIGRIKEILYSKGAVYASMTGSGAAVYGLFKETPSDLSGFGNAYCWIG